MDFQPLNESDVIAFGGNGVNFIGAQVFVSEDLLKKIRDAAKQSVSPFSDGANCKVLRPGVGWQEGTIRLNLEFRPRQNP